MNDLEFETLAPQEQKLSWSYVLSRSYGLYAEHFWTYFRIALVPSLMAYAFRYFERPASHYFLRSGFSPTFSPKWLTFAISIAWIEGAVYWAISAFFFAAIASTFATEKPDTPAIADAFTLPRKLAATLFFIALLTWTLFFLCRSIAGFAVIEILQRFRLTGNYWVTFSAVSLILVLVAGLLSKFGLVVPELMGNLSTTGREAIRNSIKSTEGWEIFFMMFLTKSAVLGYAAYWATGFGMDWIWNHWDMGGTAYSCVQWAIYIFIAATLESPLFIAFSVLYSELQACREKSIGVGTA
ncbi:MAG TPA: hypothetical protein VGK22_11890 [Candidatus Angelobacter sp.]|jgi:hypothetical protein